MTWTSMQRVGPPNLSRGSFLFGTKVGSRRGCWCFPAGGEDNLPEFGDSGEKEFSFLAAFKLQPGII